VAVDDVRGRVAVKALTNKVGSVAEGSNVAGAEQPQSVFGRKAVVRLDFLYDVCNLTACEQRIHAGAALLTPSPESSSPNARSRPPEWLLKPCWAVRVPVSPNHPDEDLAVKRFQIPALALLLALLAGCAEYKEYTYKEFSVD